VLKNEDYHPKERLGYFSVVFQVLDGILSKRIMNSGGGFTGSVRIRHAEA
jgi:hypothetical protein